MTASPDASVEEDIDLIAHRAGDSREGADGGRGAVEVVAAVVRDRNGADTGVHRSLGVVDPAHALQHEGTSPLLA
jgi:hypothetical protein